MKDLDPTRLDDPVYVFQAMQRGQIAKLTNAHVQTLYKETIDEAVIMSLKKQSRLLQETIDLSIKRMTWLRNITIVLAIVNVAVVIGM
ncbi:hypothetical protein [Paracoccus liaowanqingii]|uniref:hypothetical protein n=1 Tax=Paracoccus liaowanqingii TaxID=2560053 RepID=UPI00159BB5DF|nr:hypothetical protein [Paracoccus liaowanqingii]